MDIKTINFWPKKKSKFKISSATWAAKTPTVKEELFQSKPYKFAKKTKPKTSASRTSKIA